MTLYFSSDSGNKFNIKRLHTHTKTKKKDMIDMIYERPMPNPFQTDLPHIKTKPSPSPPSTSKGSYSPIWTKKISNGFDRISDGG